MFNVFLDIETIPDQSGRALDDLREEASLAKLEVKAPANYKDAVKIGEYIQAKCEEIDAEIENKYRKTALDGSSGELLVIGYAINDQKILHTIISDGDEDNVLKIFYERLTEAFEENNRSIPCLIGHNITGFDLRFLYQRSIILGVKPPSFINFNAKPWDDCVFDTMTQWAGHGNRVKLNKICRALGIETKGDIDGGKVFDYYQAGRIEEIAEYCSQDVARVRQIYNRMTFAK